jgi:hypothetical protein
MKKIFLLLFVLFNFSFAEYKIVHNGDVYCAQKVKNHSLTQIKAYSRKNTTSGYYWYPLDKQSITFAETGYTYTSSCSRNASLFPISYDVYNEIKEENIDLQSSTFQQKLLNSKNIVKDLFVLESTEKETPTCTDGSSQNDAGQIRYYGPDRLDNLYTKNMASITKAFYGAIYNKDLNKCIYPSETSPIDLKSYFDNPSQQGYYGTIPTELQTLKKLLVTKNNLPNPNSLENKFDIDTTSSSLNCNNSLYSLQEKMLCEMNAGLRKLNQESNPKYSLNNLLSILITSNDKNSEETNKSIKAISSFEEVRLQKQLETNTLLTATKTNQDLINTNLLKIDATLKGVETNSSGHVITVGGGSSGGTVTPEPQEIDLDKYFKADETINNDDLDSANNQTDSLIDSLFSSFTNFKTNIEDSFNTINSQINGLNDVILNPTNIFSKVETVSCPVSYQADFSAFGIGKKTLTVDYCLYTSMLQPIIYFFTYVSLFLGLIFFTFRFIGVLL